MDENKAPCPLCGELINIWDTEWKCPACGTLDKHWNFMSNCEWCHFGPHFLKCPHCKEDFDLSLLMGNFEHSSVGSLIKARQRIIRPAVCYHRLGELIKILNCEPDQKVKGHLTDKFISLFENFEFYFPVPILCVMIHTIFVSQDNRLWLHSWLFANAKPGENEQPLGQLSLVYPGRIQVSGVDDTKIDCVINEIFA